MIVRKNSFFLEDRHSKNIILPTLLLIFFVTILTETVQGAGQLLRGPGFEHSTANSAFPEGGCGKISVYSGNAYAVVTTTSARSGNNGLWRYTENESWVYWSRPYQEFYAAPGQSYISSAWIRRPSGEDWIGESLASVWTITDSVNTSADLAYKHFYEVMDKYNVSFDVYTDHDADANHFFPSGWMGDTSSISFDSNWTTNCYSGTSCIKITFSANDSNWAGVYWQEPENNWGNLPDVGYDLRGFSQVSFWARGENGGETVEFFVGGIEGSYPDSLKKTSSGYITLTNSWQEYTIDLTSKDLSYVIGGFGWVINSTNNIKGATFYLDEIRYDKTSANEILGNFVTSDLWIRAVINTVEKGPSDAFWQKGGEDTTSRGDTVIWGHFYASPTEVTWGSPNNPDLFIKIWFDVSGRIDVNFFHVSVPDIEVYSDYPYDGTTDQHGTTTMSRRYIRQYYEGGQSYSDENYEDGNPPSGYSPAGNPSGYSTINNLRIGSMINTVEKGPIDALWRLGGQDTTARGDQVVWGHFYASPSDVTWGSLDNPDLFVKIWFDVSGRVDVNFFHVSVPDIEVYSDLPSDVTYDQKGTTIMDNRYIRHEYWR
jgi:hypothetical protein